MSGARPALRPSLRARPRPPLLPAPVFRDTHEMVLAELCATLFASLPRSDQRRHGAAYVRGLLQAPGRKTVRNIAALLGGRGTEQSLHHFVSSSTWEWAPVRRALARYLVRSLPPRAWVVRTMVVPKAGANSVGVERRYFPALGRVRNAQQSVGVWAASEETSVPVNWRLHLSRSWLDDGLRRARAGIPEEVRPETVGECALRAYLGMAEGWELPVRPVVMDARQADAAAAAGRLRAAGLPFLLRVGGALRLTGGGPGSPGPGGEALLAHQLMGAAGHMRRPLPWRDHDPRGTLRTSATAAVRVRLAGYPEELLLLGVGPGDGPWPAELWLTDRTETRPVELLRLTRLVRRVERDLRRTGTRVGLRDYTGRSYHGWHRHLTLSSAAHAVAALAREQLDRGRPRGPRAARHPAAPGPVRALPARAAAPARTAAPARSAAPARGRTAARIALVARAR